MLTRAGVFSADVSSVNVVSIAGSGALVISAYAVCPDITATVTPDLEDPDGKGIAHTNTHTAKMWILRQ